MSSVRWVDDATIAGVATIEMALEAAESCARATSSGQVIASRAQVGGGPAGWMRALVTLLPELDTMGYKVLFGGREGGARYVCQLVDLADGRPRALLDGATITRLRTAAHAAVAVGRRFGGRPVSVGLIGSGHEAKQAARTLAVRPGLTSLAVWSPRAESRAAFAAEMGAELGVDVRAAETPRSCLEGVDVAYSATTSGGHVVIDADDLAGVPMLATVGSTTPRQREVAPAVFEAAGSIVVDTLDCVSDSGDLIEHARSHPATAQRFTLLGTYLDDPAATLDDRLFVYKSIGSAEQDLYLAHRVLAVLTGDGAP